MRVRPPKAGRFTPGGEFDGDEIYCDRCDNLSSRSYEGVDAEWLQLCEDCYDDLGEWLGEGI